MQGALWVSMPIIRNSAMIAAKNKADLQAICGAGGITIDDLENADIKLTLQQNCAITAATVTVSGDANMGLHTGEKTTQTVLGIIGYLMESSENALVALQNLQQYTSAVTRLFTFITEVKNDEAIYYAEPVDIWNDTSPETARQSVDVAFAGALHIIRLLTGKNFHPKKVMYRYDQPKDISEHERIFKCRPVFDQSANCMIFSLKDMQYPVIGYNKELNRIFKNLLDNKIKKGQEAGFTHRVRNILMLHYQLQFPQLEQVASLLHITPRTLQRKLQEENTSFRMIADSIRQEIACNLLRNHSFSISDIAYKLGYTELSAFQRAFRQWTGKTPGTFRAASL